MYRVRMNALIGTVKAAFMIEDLPTNSSTLHKLQCMGPASAIVDVLYGMLGHSKFFVDFTRENIVSLANFMQVYHAVPGDTIIREGETDDYMLFIMEGLVNVVKTDMNGELRAMTSVGPGATLGEMSMIDGEPRFASCIAIDATTFSVFSRDSMVDIIMADPALGAKILIKLVTLLSQRLRETSTSLLPYLQRSDTV
jgi:CRP/FNR family cyclic AMP-dependent transcriptional regulator